MDLIKSYKWEILLFGAILVALLICSAPDITYINTDSDGVHYTWAARDLRLAHPFSAPLYLMVGHIFTSMAGNDFWNMAVFSSLSTVGTCVFIYLIVRRFTKNRILWYLAPLLFVSNPIVFGQSTIVDTYPFVTLFCVASYYFYIKEKYYSMSAMIAMGLAVHHLIFLAAIPIFAHNFLTRYTTLNIKWKHLLVMALGGLFYIYVPLVSNKTPYMWGDGEWINFFLRGGGIAVFTLGKIAIWRLPERTLHVIGLYGVSILFIPLIFSRIKKNILLLSLALIPAVYYWTNLAPHTYVYLMPSMAFGSILLCKHMHELSKIKWDSVRQIVKLSQKPLLAASCVFLIFCTLSMDIGRTLDKDLAARNFVNQLEDIEDDALFIISGFSCSTTLWIYSSDHDKNWTVLFLPRLKNDSGLLKYIVGYKFPEDAEDKSIDELEEEFISLNNIKHYYSIKSVAPDVYGFDVIELLVPQVKEGV